MCAHGRWATWGFYSFCLLLCPLLSSFSCSTDIFRVGAHIPTVPFSCCWGGCSWGASLTALTNTPESKSQSWSGAPRMDPAPEVSAGFPGDAQGQLLGSTGRVSPCLPILSHQHIPNVTTARSWPHARTGRESLLQRAGQALQPG